MKKRNSGWQAAASGISGVVEIEKSASASSRTRMHFGAHRRRARLNAIIRRVERGG